MSLGQRSITQQITISTSTPTILDGNGFSIPVPLTLTAVPGSGGTLKVEYQVAEDGVWQLWPEGVSGIVSSTTTSRLESPVNALRFTASTADGIVEIAQ